MSYDYQTMLNLLHQTFFLFHPAGQMQIATSLSFTKEESSPERSRGPALMAVWESPLTLTLPPERETVLPSNHHEDCCLPALSQLKYHSKPISKGRCQCPPFLSSWPHGAILATAEPAPGHSLETHNSILPPAQLPLTGRL